MLLPRGNKRRCSAFKCTKQVSLELGGKSPQLVFESADLDQAANWACLGILYNTGQDCTAGSRLYVQDSIYDTFVALLVAKAQELVIGDGFDEKKWRWPCCQFTMPDLLLARS
jgi:aldehyde dehydrogenase (NAD+)